MNFHSVSLGSVPLPSEKVFIRCEFCGLEEEVTQVSALIRVERIEYHRRGNCMKNDLGLDREWEKKWKGEKQ